MNSLFRIVVSFVLCAFAHAELQVLHSESSGRGTPPGELVADSMGTLFGVTPLGGANNAGLLFSVVPGQSGASAVTHFANKSGLDENGMAIERSLAPVGNFAGHSDGSFYGVSVGGGEGNRPALIKLENSAVSVIATFPAGTSASVSSIGTPVTSLTLAADGNFYGHTKTHAFRASVGASSSITALSAFPDGLVPRSTSFRAYAMVANPDGNLYGLAETAAASTVGRVFKLTTAGVISEHAAYATGARFGYQGAITLLPDGTMMVVSENSVGSQGAVFEVTVAATTRLIRTFTTGAATIARPKGQLCRMSDGALYGVCDDGGANGRGGIYKLVPDATVPPNYTFTKVLEFTDASDGGKPICGMVLAGNGKMYGTTAVATTTSNNAVFESVSAAVFEFDPATDAVTFIHRFNTPTGWQYSGQLLHEGAAAYLVASRGRPGDTGVVTRLDTTGMVQPSPLVPMNENIYLRKAVGPLGRDANGNLVGIRETERNSPRIEGAFFRINSMSQSHSIVGSLGNAAAISPVGGVLQRANGEVWGHENIADNFGTVSASLLFKLDGMAQLSLGHQFNAAGGLGVQTSGNLVEDGAGNLFGICGNKVYKIPVGGSVPAAHATVPASATTNRLAIAIDGTLFHLGSTTLSKITPSGVVSKIYDFTGLATNAKGTSEGVNPRDLALGSDGLLYGICERGGATGFPGQGTIWRINPATKVFTKLFDLSGANGTGPHSISRDANGRLYVVTPFTVLAFNAPRESNKLPRAVADSANLPVLNFDVTANDSDGDSDPLTITSVTQGKAGGVSFSGATVTYTPGSNFKGTDTFSYTVGDGAGGSATAIVTVKNQAPVAVADAAPISGNSVEIDVLANDSDSNGDALGVTISKQPALGTAVVNMSGTVTYTRGPKFVSADAFEYTINDGHGGIAKAKVAVEAPVTFARGNYRAFLASPFSALGRTIDLTMSAKGGVTGTVNIFGKKTTVKTAYPLMGPLSITATDAMGTPVSILLTLNISGSNVPTLDGTIGGDAVSLERPIYSSKVKSPHAGYYTATGRDPDFIPEHSQGVSVVTFTIADDGKVKFAGKLSDGVPFTAASVMYNAGDIPLYATPYGAKTFNGGGFLTGVLHFNPMPVVADFSAPLRWVRPALKDLATPGAYYPNGFDATLEVEAARYAPTKPVLSGLSVTSPNIVASVRHGGVTELVETPLAVTVDGTLSATNAISFPQPNGLLLSLKVNPKNGLVSGFITPQMSTKRAVFGVVQKRRNELGCTFLGIAPDSGSIVVQPAD